MVWSVNLRSAGRKLPSLGDYRLADGYDGLNLIMNCSNNRASNANHLLINAINGLISAINDPNHALII